MILQYVQHLVLRETCGFDHDVPAAKHDLDKSIFALIQAFDLLRDGVHEIPGNFLTGPTLHRQFIQAVEEKKKPRFTLLSVEGVVGQDIEIGEVLP